MQTILETTHLAVAHAPNAATHPSKDAELKDACSQFEALVVSKLLSGMRDSIPDDGMLPHSQGEKIFQQMLDDEYAKQISHSTALGMGAMLYRQMSQSLSPANTGAGK